MFGWLFRPMEMETILVCSIAPGTAKGVVGAMERRGYTTTVIPDERVARTTMIFTKPLLRRVK